MVSKPEELVSRSLRAVLADLPDGADIGDSEQFRTALSGLEIFLTLILREIHTAWDHESLDGILPLLSRKTGEGEAEIFGMTILISDQTVTPLHLSLQVAADRDEVSWLECRIGEQGKLGMTRVLYNSRDSLWNRLYLLAENKEQINWQYAVTYGERRVSITGAPTASGGPGHPEISAK